VSSDTILVVKEKFHDKEGLLPAQQCLLFAGHELGNDKTLSDYDIIKEATLNVVERVLAAPAPLEAMAAATSAGEIVAAFARIAASVAAEPPTITISKVALIAAYKIWREGHPDLLTEQAALAFGEALKAFRERAEVNGAGGDAGAVAGGGGVAAARALKEDEKRAADEAARAAEEAAEAREVAERGAREEAEALRRMREQNEAVQAKIDEQEREVQRIEKEKPAAEEQRARDEAAAVKEAARVKAAKEAREAAAAEQYQREIEAKEEEEKKAEAGE
jgi:hypothetical protein